MRQYAFPALWITVLVQVSWMVLDRFAAHAWYLVVLVAGFAMLAATFGRWRWIAASLRVFLGLDFLGSVSDRFGLLGPPGAAGVAWGDFGHFVTYTHQVNAFLPADVAPALAVLATIAEISLGFGLVLGVRVRLAALGASMLLLTYGIAMTISLGVASQFPYAVFMLSAGAWALATVDARPLSVDLLLARLRPREVSS